MDVKFTIDLFDKKHHKIDDFTCGVQELDRYIKERAGQEIKKKVSAVYVICEKDSKQIIGYYTLSASSVELNDLQEDVIRKLPKYKALPVILLGRLAVDKRFQGKRMGEYLLIDALNRSYILSRQIGSFAVIVDAKSEKSRDFYIKYGFISLQDQPLKLYISMSTIKDLVDNDVVS